MKKFLAFLMPVLVFGMVSFTAPASAATDKSTSTVKISTMKQQEPSLTTQNLSDITKTSKNMSDASGWQLLHTDSWYVDNNTTTEPNSFSGGGIKACFSGQNYAYSVQLKENDNVNPDDVIGSPKYVSSTSGSCVSWSGVNSEAGNEELYVTLTKASTATDLLTIRWYD